MSTSAPSTLEHLDVENRRVLVRLDLDLQHDRAYHEDAPDSGLGTIRELLHRGARVVLAGHRRAPQADQKPPSLRRAGSRLAQALNTPVQLPDEVVGDGVRKLIRDTRAGQIVLLENLDLDPREATADAEQARDLGRALTELCDIFVLDGVDAALSSRASVLEIPKRLPAPMRGAGHRVERHLESVQELLRPAPQRTAILFGAQRADVLQLAALAKLIETRGPQDSVILGGPLGLQFAALAGETPDPSIDATLLGHMRAILKKIRSRGIELATPHDTHIETAPIPEEPGQPDAAERTDPTRGSRPVPDAIVWGPRSRRDLISALHAERVLWLGPLSPGPGSLDENWLAQRLAQHERSLIAVGEAPVRALAEHAPEIARSDALRGLAFVHAGLAKAPMPGIQALTLGEERA